MNVVLCDDPAPAARSLAHLSIHAALGLAIHSHMVLRANIDMLTHIPAAIPKLKSAYTSW